MAEERLDGVRLADELDRCEDEVTGVRRLVLILGAAVGEEGVAMVLAGCLEGTAARLEAVRERLAPDEYR